MNRQFVKKYFLIILVLFSLIIAPFFLIEHLRAKTIVAFSPLWKGINKVNYSLRSQSTKYQNECKRLEAENYLLKTENIKLKAFLEQEIPETYKKEKKTLAAQVLFRDPSSWSSSFWIDIGEENNPKGQKILMKNSPVLYGKGVVGVVDFVGKRQSRVRLITDSGLKISVRAARGSFQNLYLSSHIEAILQAIEVRPDLLLSVQEKVFLVKKFQSIKEQLSTLKDGWYLAKGILYGSGSPLWRKKVTLKGFGFNYDFDDAEGPARDLYSGAPQDLTKGFPLSLIQADDLLVTTGMDGVFPSHLPVAKVTKVFPLKEGSYTYDIEAKPIVSNIDELKFVFIIPSLEFTPELL